MIDWKDLQVDYVDDGLLVSQVISYLLNLFLQNFLQTHHVHNNAEIPEVSDKTELESVSAEDRTGRWARSTFKIVLSYHGGYFDGWQKQPGLNTVQG